MFMMELPRVRARAESTEIIRYRGDQIKIRLTLEREDKMDQDQIR